MALHKVLVGILVLLMVSPAWGSAEPLGSVVSGNDATVRDSKLTSGSTVFTGDVISVAARGGTRIALTNGAQAEILSNSSVQLTKKADQIQMAVNRGLASFHTSSGTGVSALVGDATVRPATGAETSAIVQSLSETHAIVAAAKGALLITTAPDGKVYTLREGEAADFTASEVPQQNGGAVPAGKAAPPYKPSKKKVVIWTVAVVGSGVIVTGYLLARKETKLSTTQLGNEISPHTLN